VSERDLATPRQDTAAESVRAVAETRPRTLVHIRRAKSTQFGRYRLWAGKVGNEKIVSIEPIAVKSPASSVGKSSVAPAARTSPTATAAASDLVSFKVAARSSTAETLLVPPDTSEADLTKLVNALRTARGKNTLGKFLLPTTPNGSNGPFGIVMLFVMSDPVWATEGHLQSFVNSESGLTAADKAFGKRVLAYYYFTSLMNLEFGTIGYADEGHQYTAKYKKLF
jgi:hypothetical protein